MAVVSAYIISKCSVCKAKVEAIICKTCNRWICIGCYDSHFCGHIGVDDHIGAVCD